MSKKIVISLGVVMVLTAYLVISNWECSSDGKIPSWEESSEIVITGPDGSIRLTKKEDRWRIGDEGYPADPAKVENLEKSLRELSIVNLVSKKGFFKKYELTPDKYTEVMVKKGKETVLKVKFGKKSSTGRHTFVRTGDEPEIYLASGTYDSLLNTGVAELRDKTVFKITGDSITSFEVTYRGRGYAFTKKSYVQEEKAAEKGKPDKKEGAVKTVEKWVVDTNETAPLDQGKITSLLNSFNPLRASTFPDLEKDSLKNRMPLSLVRIKAFSKEITLSILYRNGDGRYVCISSESPYVFTIEEWLAEKFFINTIDTLMEK